LVDGYRPQESVVSSTEFSKLCFVGVGPAIGAERDWIEGDGFRLGIGG
jgi:hypothetical protein